MDHLQEINGVSVGQILEDAWLGIAVKEETLYNPFEEIPYDVAERPELYYTWLLTRPEYFALICKVLLNIDLAPFQAVILKELWTHKFPMLVGSRGMSKTFLLAVYAILRSLLIPDRKVIIVGSVFRQSKLVFGYVEQIYKNSPMLRNITDDEPRWGNDRCRFNIGSSKITALPVGNSGDKIRGERSTEILADEFAAQSKEIFENVISGFGAVSSDPVSKVKKSAAKKFAKSIGLILDDEEEDAIGMGNQIVLSGTAYYYFNHFAQYWEKWRQIIRTKNDPKKIEELFGDMEVDDQFNADDYSVIRIPADILPAGFMDEAQLARSRATLSADMYALEFSGIFSRDSNGFFKASLLDKCTANEENNIKTANGDHVIFEPKIKGDPNKQYVFGIDPASEIDKFAIVVIELAEDHRKIVHCWTTNTKTFKAKRKAGLIEENDFYGYTARKIRDLMIDFPCYHIAIDSQGGGKAVYEALHDDTKLKDGEQLLWEVLEEGKVKDTDGEEGLHIIELVNFASAEYTSMANHTMKKDFEDRVLLFPRFNPAVAAIAGGGMSDTKNLKRLFDEDGEEVSLYDTFEDCIEEIENLKRELSQIIITQTPSGREKWDTPDVKVSGSEKGKMRKDRYSALVMANAASRKMSGPNLRPKYNTIGLLGQQETKAGQNFIGPSWAINQLNDLYN